ncbi:HAD hydrolase-like protein [Streptomyces broussonetiae]|uniref:HAD hydrolase-like protein n=1 Tax=Streptomyces broussonetiae TaxID=2686304 RepID=A0A6I6MWG2_9ACTN|nr:HAD family hydrolase [Streptomyces broussonetiae]QHA04723.1 HAD hydrolase-like protein [Streptomyces broussonetiae]
MPSDSLTRTLVAAEAVLFDFDGPLCDVFAGLPAPRVARDLCRLAAEHDPELRAKLEGISDPLEVLRLTYDSDRSLSSRVEEALITAEIEAVQVAGSPTGGGVEAMVAVRRSGRPITVVTNNSPDCVRSFFDLHGLSYLVDDVVGRVFHRPDLMKPNPYAVLRAAEQLDLPSAACVLIGDSLTDIQAAHTAGGSAIGYANKPRKREAFAEAGAEAIIEDMGAIAHALGYDVKA